MPIVGLGLFPISMEHGCPHGIVKGGVSVPKIRFGATDTLMFGLHTPGLLIVQRLVAVIVGPGALAVVPFHAAMGHRTAGVDGLTVAERGPPV